MDKRSLIAILVTFGILIAWQMIYVRPKQQEAARVRIEQAIADSIATAEAAEGADHVIWVTSGGRAVNEGDRDDFASVDWNDRPYSDDVRPSEPH